MAVPPPHPEKSIWRRRLRDARRLHVDELARTGLLDEAAGAAARHALPFLSGQHMVALYHAVGRELDPAPLARLLHGSGRRLALPRMRSGSPLLDFAGWAPGEPLGEGPHGIAQPGDDAPSVRPDVIVAPLLGFDPCGTRLGQGMGCYDRAFAALPSAWRIGYGWNVQQADALPRDPWDLPLRAVATETGWIACETAR